LIWGSFFDPENTIAFCPLLWETRIAKTREGFEVCKNVKALSEIKIRRDNQFMCAYDSYWFDETEKTSFYWEIKRGREDPLDITRESILDLEGSFVRG